MDGHDVSSNGTAPDIAEEAISVQQILLQVSSLRASLGLPPPPNISEKAQENFTETSRTDAAAHAITDGHPPPGLYIQQRSENATYLRDEACGHLLSDLLSAESARDRTAALATTLCRDAHVMVSCEQLANLLRTLKLPAERLALAKLLRGRVYNPARLHATVLPVLCGETVDNWSEIFQALL
eukprot:m.162402 g.162402  ORF g.162402 m.162402 type:complete len:183 (-) comp18068_c0_seq3:327-875(-)